jgi:hypothetical protein
MTDEIKKYLFYGIVLIAIIWLLRKVALSIKYGMQKEQTVDSSKLLKNKTYYQGVALGLYNAFNGLTQLQRQKDEALNAINVSNDEEFKYVYNVFNHNYTTGSDTLTTWVFNERVGIFFDSEEKTNYLTRAKKLGLG